MKLHVFITFINSTYLCLEVGKSHESKKLEDRKEDGEGRYY
jgi:hypothetical protein